MVHGMLGLYSGGVAECGRCGEWESQCMGDPAHGDCRVCGVLLRAGCGVQDLQCMGVAMHGGCNV